MIENTTQLPISLDICDIYERNDNIVINIFDKKFTMSVGGHTRSIQPYELIKFIGSIRDAELSTIQRIPYNPIKFGNIIGIILHSCIRKYTFKWGENLMRSAFGHPRYISKELNIHTMTAEELEKHSISRDDIDPDALKDYHKIYGEFTNPVLPVAGSSETYYCKLFQPEFLLIHNGNVSAGGFIHAPDKFDYITHTFREEYSFEDIKLISEPTNTYSSGKLCIQESKNISDAIHHYYSDVYNTDLIQDYFTEMVTMQYKFANAGNSSTTRFFSQLSEEVDDLKGLTIYEIIRKNLL